MASVPVTLNGSAPDGEYPSPYVCEAAMGDSIKFTALNSEFDVLIHNKDRFFDTSQDILNYNIKEGEHKETPPISTNLSAGLEKYYSAYCVLNNDFADKPENSPPKIIVIST
ncbi:MAG: hypothetical protein R3321_04250 [Nitrososphaeraceae archaeon]|nr:hypothetical protein [Nitrososphaeraceae archaeon]